MSAHDQIVGRSPPRAGGVAPGRFSENTDIPVSLRTARMAGVKTFVLIFHGYADPSPELVAAWDDWFRRRAASFADVGRAFGPGRSIVVASHIDAAEQLLEGCPIVESVSLYEALPGANRWGDPGSAGHRHRW